MDPDLPEITAAEWQAYLAVESLNYEDRIRYGASIDDDRMVGLGHLGLKRSPENRHQASCEIDGISEAGETLLGVICDAATGAGGTWTVRPPERGDRRVRPPSRRNAA